MALRPLPDSHHYTHFFLVLGKPKLHTWGPQMCSQVSFAALLFTLPINTAQHRVGLCHKGRLLSHTQFSVHQDKPHVLFYRAALEPAGPSLSSCPVLLHPRCIGCFRISRGFFHTISPAWLRGAALLCSENLTLDLVSLKLAEYPVHSHQSSC